MKGSRKRTRPELPSIPGLIIDPDTPLSARIGAYPASALSLLQDAEGLTLRQALNLYEELITPTKKGQREERTVIGVICNFAVHMLDLKLTEIGPKHIATYRNIRRKNPSVKRHRNGVLVLRKPPSDTTIRKELCLLSDVFRKAALEWGLEAMPNPVVSGIRPKAAQGRIRRLSDEERALIFAAARDYQLHEQSSVPILAAIELGVETAMRLGELASIRWEDVDFDRSFIQLQTSKNGDARAVPLKPRALEILRELGPARSGSVFGCTSETIRTAWNRVRRRSGVQNFRFHDLRHEAISELIERADHYGLSLPEVMFIAGHKTLSMVTRYYHALAPRIARKLAR